LSWLNQEGNAVKQNFQWGFYTDPGFLEMFSFSWQKGGQQNALEGSNKVVLSESTARKLFGNEWEENDNIIGQTLEYINEFDRFSLVITGIIADAPENSHFQYDFLASFATLSTGWAKDFMETWDGNRVYTYLQLAPSVDVSAFLPKIHEFITAHGPQEIQEKVDFGLQPLQDIHLHSQLEEELKVNGNATYVFFLSLIAALILIIALVNYINLTTAKAVTRGNEVGLRKVMGALRPQLIKQFLFESLLLNGVAYILAITILQAAMPFYTRLTGKTLDYGSEFWWFILLLFPVSTLLSGLYPAFVLSGYHPMQALKGKLIYSPHGKQLRRGMVVFQFWISMILIIFTFTVTRQLYYMRASDPGFNREGVIVVKGPGNRTETWIEHDQQRHMRTHEDIFKDAVSQYTGVKAVSLSWSIPGERSSIWPIALGEAYANSKIDVLTTDNDYAEVYGLELLAGRFDTDHGYVINESAAVILGYDNPTAAVGQVFIDDGNHERNILGVVKDYHHHSLQHEIRPLIFASNDPTYKLDSYYSIKVEANHLEATLAQIDAAYEKVYPYDLFEYYFIDTYFDAQYREDIRFGTLFGLFSGLTIFIACLGLFGLSLHTVIEKTKEIGIRKVLGASVQNILALLAQNTLKLILIACILALPIAYWSIQAWLSNYAFRIDVRWWLFALPVLIVPAVVLITISFHTVKAALANPVKSLRNE
jgi:putative ABC transport system permease protein